MEIRRRTALLSDGIRILGVIYSRKHVCLFCPVYLSIRGEKLFHCRNYGSIHCSPSENLSNNLVRVRRTFCVNRVCPLPIDDVFFLGLLVPAKNLYLTIHEYLSMMGGLDHGWCLSREVHDIHTVPARSELSQGTVSCFATVMIIVLQSSPSSSSSSSRSSSSS